MDEAFEGKASCANPRVASVENFALVIGARTRPVEKRAV
jgi:hypothetical protein